MEEREGGGEWEEAREGKRWGKWSKENGKMCGGEDVEGIRKTR